MCALLPYQITLNNSSARTLTYVIASRGVAIQAKRSCRGLDCFVASAPRNDAKWHPPSQDLWKLV
jgi:hypothetical protein